MFVSNKLSCGPSPNTTYPIPNNKSVVFLKNIVTKPRILVGDYTTYSPIDDNYRNFESSNILYYSKVLNDKLIIGKFCHISSNVKFMMNAANHTYSNFTSYGFGFLGNGWESDSCNPQMKALGYPSDHIVKGDIMIGNSVWIGYDSLILPGVRIGDGAVVGARSVVTKDVPPYCVVAGNPAKIVKQIFPNDIIKILLDLKWWDLPIEIITENLSVISGNDVQALLAFYHKIKTNNHCSLMTSTL